MVFYINFYILIFVIERFCNYIENFISKIRIFKIKKIVPARAQVKNNIIF
ncbi:hypothetical protein LEQ41_00415 [Streptococcus agalactiae]|nr:hypothetical protein [Streptococcus agalactiae]